MTIPFLFLSSQISNIPPSHPCLFSLKIETIRREFSSLQGKCSNLPASIHTDCILSYSNGTLCLHLHLPISSCPLLLIQDRILTIIPSDNSQTGLSSLHCSLINPSANQIVTWVTNKYLKPDVQGLRILNTLPSMLSSLAQ